MKVGTDAVLLGAWADISGAERILDIGTGSGVIALMLAQRSNAIIDAIDIDEISCAQANENFKASLWAERLKAKNFSLKEFTEKKFGKYNLVVSNPPYFTDSYKPADERRNSARHNDLLPFSELIDCTAKLLSGNGKFCVIIPVKESETFISIAEKHGLSPSRITTLFPTSEKSAFRKLILFSFKKRTVSYDDLIIEEAGPHDYSKEYKELTKEYYTIF